MGGDFLCENIEILIKLGYQVMLEAMLLK